MTGNESADGVSESIVILVDPPFETVGATRGRLIPAPVRIEVVQSTSASGMRTLIANFQCVDGSGTFHVASLEAIAASPFELQTGGEEGSLGLKLVHFCLCFNDTSLRARPAAA